MTSPASASPAPRKRVSGVVVPNAPTRLQRVLAWLALALMRLLTLTIRIRIHDPRGMLRDRSAPAIFTLWHNRLALTMHIYHKHTLPGRGRKLAALVSASKDGAFLAAILERAGVQPVRGSSSRRGGQALIELNSWAQAGYDIAITPDGPRGPCYQVQDGVIALAQVTGLPILPGTYRLNWKIRVKSWDRFQIPIPFARCEIYFGDPVTVPRDASDEDRARLRQRLQDALMEKTQGD